MSIKNSVIFVVIRNLKSTFMEEKAVSIWKSTIITGVYIAVVLILLSVVFYVTGNPFSKVAQYLTYPIFAICIIWAQFNYDKALGGNITYGQAFFAGTLAVFFASIFSGLYTFVLYQFIDPSLQEQMKLYTEEQILKQGNIPEEQMEIALNMALKFQKPIIMLLISIFGGAFFGLFFSLIITGLYGMWKTYEKANEPGWASIVPVYNMIVLVRIINKPFWWVIMFFIPIINLVFLIWAYNLLAKCFRKDVGFTVGLVLLGFIFFPLLGFGDSEYTKPELLENN